MKKKFVLRIDEDDYDALEKWAADEFRSVNGQIEWLLAYQLKLNGRYKNLKDKGQKDEEKQSLNKDEDSLSQ